MKKIVPDLPRRLAFTPCSTVISEIYPPHAIAHARLCGQKEEE